MRFDLSRDELDALVEKAREASRLELADQRLWPSLKARYRELAAFARLLDELEGRAQSVGYTF